MYVKLHDLVLLHQIVFVRDNADRQLALVFFAIQYLIGRRLDFLVPAFDDSDFSKDLLFDENKRANENHTQPGCPTAEEFVVKVCNDTGVQDDWISVDDPEEGWDLEEYEQLSPSCVIRGLSDDDEIRETDTLEVDDVAAGPEGKHLSVRYGCFLGEYHADEKAPESLIKGIQIP